MLLFKGEKRKGKLPAVDVDACNVLLQTSIAELSFIE